MFDFAKPSAFCCANDFLLLRFTGLKPLEDPNSELSKRAATDSNENHYKNPRIL